MADFTKKELNHMLNGISFIKDECEMIDKTKLEIESLFLKLESMIDNYCEHKSDGFIYTNAEISNDLPYKCHKCGDYFDN